MRITVIAITAVAMLGTPALAQTDPSTPPTAAKPVKEKKICRKEPVLGSSIPQSTCHTKAEWDQIDAANQQNMSTRQVDTPAPN